MVLCCIWNGRNNILLVPLAVRIPEPSGLKLDAYLLRVFVSARSHNNGDEYYVSPGGVVVVRIITVRGRRLMCKSRDAPLCSNGWHPTCAVGAGRGARVSALMNKQTTVRLLFRVSCLP